MMEELKSAVYEVKPISVIRDMVHRHHKGIEEEYPDGLDLLHHAIIANYSEVVNLLMLKGYFQVPSCPKNGLPYLHLACCLGFSRVTYVLLEQRPCDFSLKCTNWKRCLSAGQNPSVITNIGDRSIQKMEIIESRLSNICSHQNGVTAVDMAAVCCNLQCLKTLLTCDCRKFKSNTEIERAVEMGSVSALRLLLEHEDFSTEELDDAFRFALRWKFPKCIDALLSSGARVRKAFNGINPYHVLFMYSSGYTSPASNMLESIRVLTSYNLDVNCGEPIGSYPLYSLVHMMLNERHTPSWQSTNMACLEMLLRAGANPNFDEIELLNNTEAVRFAVGRECFSSALNAVFLTLELSDTWQVQHSLEPLGQACRLLLQHGSDPNHIDILHRTTPLHDLMKLWARQHAMGYMQLPLCQIQSILLSYGADPNKTAHGMQNSYPVHYYISSLTELMGGLIAYERWLTLVTPSHVLRLLLFMDSTCAAEAGKGIVECCQKAIGAGMPTKALQEIQNSVWRVLHEAQTLLSLSQLAVWKAIGRNFHAAEIRKWLKINIPKKILHDLDNMFVCH